METKMEEKSFGGWLSWLTVVGGWLLCATMCLILTIRLEVWPKAYDFFFPAAVAVLFSNIFVFMFMASRYGAHAGKLFRAVCRVCLSEGILLFLFYGWGRFFIGA